MEVLDSVGLYEAGYTASSSRRTMRVTLTDGDCGQGVALQDDVAARYLADARPEARCVAILLALDDGTL